MAKYISIKMLWKQFLDMAGSRVVQVALVISVLCLAGSFFLPVWRLFPEIKATIAIPLHYNVYSGVDLFGPWRRIFTVPIIGAIILVLNTVLAYVFWQRERVLSYFFLTATTICEILAFVSMIFIVLQLLVWIT